MYSTPAMVRLALVPSGDGSLPNPASHTAADLTDAQLTDAIAEADALIDGYIGGYYAVPVTAVAGAIPHPVDLWSRTIAAYLASCTYRGSLDFADTDPIARRYKDVLQALKDVSAGRLRLQLPQNVGPNSATAAGAPYNPYAGDLWTPDDFSITPDNDLGAGGWPYWWGR